MITPRQKELLLFINNFQREHGFGPTYDHMRFGIGVKSKSSVSRLLIELHKKGFIRIHTAYSHGVEILKMPPGVDQIPATREHKLEKRIEALESMQQILCNRLNQIQLEGPVTLGDAADGVLVKLRGKIS